MKKFILSAVFALACFTAQAKNEVIKNNDDKNPNTITETQVSVILLGESRIYTCTYTINIYCGNGVTTSVSGFGVGQSYSEACGMAAEAAEAMAGGACS